MFRRATLLVLLFAFTFSRGFCELNCEKHISLVKFLVRNHYSAPAFNDSTEKRVFKIFLDNLDPEKSIFTIKEVDSLRLLTKGILDTNVKSCNFLKTVSIVYKRRLIYSDSLTKQIGRKPIQFLPSDSIHLSGGKEIPFATSDKDLERRKTVRLKYDFLFELYSMTDDSVKSKEKITALIKENETSIRSKLTNEESCYLEKLISPKEGYEKSIEMAFMKAIAMSFDPHTEYFTQQEVNSFIKQLSSESGTTGMKFINKEGKLTVGGIIPGSPAWKSNKVHAGDQILKISTSNTSITDLTCMDADEAENIINSSPGNWTELEVRNQDGGITKVKLVKEMMRVEDNKVNACILSGKTKAGYISLPDFYTSGNYFGPGCANDVAKEILKMQSSRIDGLILDLRFNGGGSIEEAIDLAGIFIDIGPLGFIKSKDIKTSTLKDINRGTAYNGNLILLVNGYSASASELVAGILQDYNRAIIAGQTTYGKATGQVILPLNERTLSDGYVKVTQDKIYRLTGESNQLRGVIPDIRLPDIYEELFQREEDQPGVLVRDTVQKKVQYMKQDSLPVSALRESSQKRINSSKTFKGITEKNKKLKKTRSESGTLPLDPEKMFAWFDDIYFEFDDVTEEGDSTLKIENNAYEKKLMEFDSTRRDFIEATNETILNDPQIREAYDILNDLIIFRPHK